MKRRSSTPARSLILLILSLVLTGGGCSRLSREPAVLWTDLEEFAAYAEIFNTSQDEYKISIAYKPNPAHALRQSEEAPDLVVGSHLNDRHTIPLFRSLDRSFEKGFIDGGQFYQQALRLGLFEEKQTLVPVSFTLPVMIFPDGYEGIESFDLSLQEIRTLAQSFSDLENGTRMGYSPRWNPAAAFTHLRLFGAGFGENQAASLVWNGEALQEGIDYMRGWVEEVNGGWESDTEFIEKYLYDPPYKLVNSGRILFAYYRIDDYFRIPPPSRETLDFRWLSHEERIPVDGDLVFAGIPRGADRSGAARAFLHWFFQPETQKKLLETAQFKRMRLFGLAGGFSAMRIVNEIDMPRYFPELIGHIPPESFLEFPLPLPDIWEELQRESILPWIEGQLNAEPPARELNSSIERWMNQQPQI